MTNAGVLMPKGKGGRPKKSEGDAGTKAVRVYTDIGEMLGWILLIKKKKSAAYLDPLLREQITAEFEEIKPAVEAFKKADAAAQKYRDEESED